MRASSPLIFAVLAAITLPERMHAFELLRVDGNPCGLSRNLHWPPRSASVSTASLTSAAFRDLAQQARDRWNEAVFGFSLRAGSGIVCNLDDGVVSMRFDQGTCDDAPLGDAAALTRFRFDTESGELIDAEVVFNASQPVLNHQALFLEIAMHELGHVLGLDHSDACGSSGEGTLMKSTTSLAAPRIDRPQPDDIAGANFIYPPRDGSVPEGANSCAIVRPQSGHWLGAGLLVLLLRTVLRRSGLVRRPTTNAAEAAEEVALER